MKSVSLFERVAKRLASLIALPYKQVLKELHISFSNEAELAAFTNQVNADVQTLAPGFNFLDDTPPPKTKRTRHG